MTIYLIASVFIIYFVIRIATAKQTEEVKVAFAGSYDGNKTVQLLPKERNKTIYTEGEDIVDLSTYDKFLISGHSLERVGLPDGADEPSMYNRFIIAINIYFRLNHHFSTNVQ